MKEATATERYYVPDVADRLEEQREEARHKDKRPLVYDCRHAVICMGGRYVRCDLGFSFGLHKDGQITLLEVLRGRRTKVCSECAKYDGGRGETF
mgnify:FL=1